MHDLMGGLLVSGEVVPEPAQGEYGDDINGCLPLTWSRLSDWSVDSAFVYG